MHSAHVRPAMPSTQARTPACAARPRRPATARVSVMTRAASSPPRDTAPQPLAARAVAAITAALLVFTPAGPALADPTDVTAPTTSTSPSRVASFPASGLVFKDSVEVVALPDPAVPGVLIYVTEVKRSLVDKLSGGAGGFFAEPAAASVTCVATGNGAAAAATLLPGADVGGPEGRDIFAERKSLSLVAAKTLRVRRVVDREHGAVLYIAYNTRLASPGGGDPSSTDGSGGRQGSSRYRTSVCALPLAGG
jgi:CreA protein